MIKYVLDLSKIDGVPGCRGSYKVGDSYCAIGKIFKSLSLPVPVMLDDCIWHVEEATGEFVKLMDEKLGTVNWIKDISDINDSSEGNPRKNHEIALNKAIDLVLSTGIVEEKVLVNA